MKLGNSNSILVQTRGWRLVNWSIGDTVYHSVKYPLKRSVTTLIWDEITRTRVTQQYMKLGNSINKLLCNSVYESLYDPVWDLAFVSTQRTVRNSIRASIWGGLSRTRLIQQIMNLGNSTKDTVWNLLWDSMYHPVSDKVMLGSVWTLVWDLVENSVLSQYLG